jgi:hypothetical protein
VGSGRKSVRVGNDGISGVLGNVGILGVPSRPLGERLTTGISARRLNTLRSPSAEDKADRTGAGKGVPLDGG